MEPAALADLAAFNCVQVSALGLEDHFVEIFRPVAKRAVLIEVGATDLCDAGLRVALEPVKLDEVGAEFAFGDEGLDSGQQQRTVGFGDDVNAALRGPGENVSQFRLCSGVEVDFCSSR
jgi:hypothetical protein